MNFRESPSEVQTSLVAHFTHDMQLSPAIQETLTLPHIVKFELRYSNGEARWSSSWGPAPPQFLLIGRYSKEL